MSQNQFRFRSLILSPAVLLLLWYEGLLNTEPTSILFVVVVTVGLLLALKPHRQNDKPTGLMR
jgi:hypothetical protein